ncbi:MAG: DDE-type integrase/transposase/recombinase [Gammaproteobacteria bacterium]|nr:DDE-type integrase/transposase/recombinase [Gammaproteobacteria bacterium]
MSDAEQLVDVKTIARAMQCSERSVQRYAKKGYRGGAPWRTSTTVLRRGVDAQFFSIVSLPAALRHAIRNLDRAESEAIRYATDIARVKADHDARALEQLAQLSEADRAVEGRRAAKLADGRKQFSKLPATSPKRHRALAREWVVLGTYDWRKRHGGSVENSLFGFANVVNTHSCDIPDSVRVYLPTDHGRIKLCEGTLRTWRGLYQTGGIWALTDRYGNRRNDSKIERNRELYRKLLGALQKRPHITPKKMKLWLAAAHPELNVVSAGGIGRFLRRFKQENPQLWTYVTNPDQWKNIFMAAAGSVFESITRLNQMWEMDSTPGDWMLKDGRHSVIGCIDLYSRRLKFFVSKTSTAAAVKQLVRRCVLDWGMPEAIRTDNGSDYVSQEFDSLLRDLQVIHEVCIPFASEEKGTIERAFRTMSHGLLDLLPGFIGHNVADRKVIDARESFAKRVMKRGENIEVALSAQDLQQVLDQWAEHVYAQDAHAGLDNCSPREMARNWREPIARIADERALDELLCDSVGVRTITKKGLRVDGRHYWDRDGALALYVGLQVFVRRDEHDLGRLAVYTNGATYEWIGWAYHDETLGISRREFAAAVRHRQKNKMQKQANELRAYVKEVRGDPVTTIIEHRKAQAENVVDLPKPSTPYTTPALREAGRAAASRAGESPARPMLDPEQSDEQRAEHEAMLIEFYREPEPIHDVRAVEDQPLPMYAYWLWLDEEQRSGSRVMNEHDRAFHEFFPRSIDYKVGKEFFDEFPDLSPADYLPAWVNQEKSRLKAG